MNFIQNLKIGLFRVSVRVLKSQKFVESIYKLSDIILEKNV